ncbi:MAG: phosphotransferase [Pseudoxanthomonas sp.]
MTELTAEWLDSVFSHLDRPARVERVEQGRIIWGTATKVFLRVHYETQGGHGLPELLCIKGGFDDSVRAFGLAPAYELEANFYRELASTLGVPLPRCIVAEVEPEQGIMVFEDMTARGVTFPDVIAGLVPDQVAEALEVMARWQASTWGIRAPRPRWLSVGCTAARNALAVLLEDSMFSQLTGRDFISGIPDALKDAASVKRAYHALWAEDDASELTVNHGDAHVGQTYVDPEAGIAFLDWQAVCLAPWASDVAYFIGGALSPEQRRRSERELLGHYIAALVAAGGPRLDSEKAWRDYRAHTLHGFIWAVTPAQLQSEAIVSELSRRYLTAISDHGPTKLLAS